MAAATNDRWRPTLGAAKDFADLRDQYYAPSLGLLKEEFYPDRPGLLAAGIRQQNQDPTCVGHALATLIDLQRRVQRPDQPERVSAHMLYQMAHFHDALQGAGAANETKGLRGLRSAIKAFYHHGACLSAGAAEGVWSDDDKYDAHEWPTVTQAAAAEGRTLGAYYRLRPILNHYHAAIMETRSILVSARIHSGWFEDGGFKAGQIDAENSEDDDGDRGLHAFLIVGYTREGFLVLNSWGEAWGGFRIEGVRAPGIGLWTYRDWARNVVDGWVLRLGVPGGAAFPVSAGERGLGDVFDPDRRGSASTPYRDLRGSFLNLEDGKVVEFGAYATPKRAAESTVDELVKRIPDNKGVVVRIPGILDPIDVAFTRAVIQKREAERHGLLYLTCFWCADFATEINGILRDIFERCSKQAGSELKDLDALFEAAARGAGRAFWRDIERHARCASLDCEDRIDDWEDTRACDADRRRGAFGDAFGKIAEQCSASGKPLHIVAEGAGALVLDSLLDRIARDAGGRDPLAWIPALRTLALTFPAIPLERAEERILKLARAMDARARGSAYIFVPDPEVEKRITTLGYGKSILHLVANSFLSGGSDMEQPVMLGMASAPDPANPAKPQLVAPFRTFSPEQAFRIDQSVLTHDRELETAVAKMAYNPEAQEVVLAEHSSPKEMISAMPKIDIAELQQRIADGTLTPEEAAEYFTVDTEASGPFSPVIRINPDTVEVPPEEGRSALALNVLNEASRFRRKADFYQRIANGYTGPRIAAEGDSWFQYPLVLQDVIDFISRDYPVYDTSAAGDLLENMAAKREYIRAIEESGATVLLLSAGGNDLCAGGALATHLERFREGLLPADYLKRSYQGVLDNAIAWYERICRDVRARFPQVTIIIHGYDYALPDRGRWLGRPMEEQGISDRRLQRGIAAEMVDQFNRALRRMAENMPHVAYVDCRNAVREDGWHDELHPKNPGFQEVAAKIDAEIRAILARARSAPSYPSVGRGELAAPALVGPEPRAWSLHVGLNSVDPGHYAGWTGDLRGCENDARAMKKLVEAEGFTGQILLTDQGTRKAVVAEIERAASELREGDHFFFSYSGHGSQIPDFNGDEEELGRRQPDSTLCLYDCQMIDDELFDLWSRFEPGVRILVIPDSCHSGSVVRAGLPPVTYMQAANLADLQAASMQRPTLDLLPRTMPLNKADDVLRQNEPFYREMSGQFAHVRERLIMSPVQTRMKASLIQISACQDEETAYDGNEHGVFTAALLKIWDRGSFNENYREFHRRIALEVGATVQNPRLLELPPADPAFVRQRPFTIWGAPRESGPQAARPERPAAEPAETPRTLDVLLIGEGDENDMPEAGARSAPAARGTEDAATVTRFARFMGPVGLQHFSPQELFYLGGSHHAAGGAHGLNSYPPEDKWANIIPTAEVLDELRSRLGVAVRIRSGYRNQAYNRAVGGEPNSMHMQFRACDITADGVTPSKVADELSRMRTEGQFKGGIGRYPGFTHIDTRGVNADWGSNGRGARRPRAAAPAYPGS